MVKEEKGDIMPKTNRAAKRTGEVKERIPVWLYPSTLAAIDRGMELDNCKSRSEFLEEAARFYAGYLSGGDACDFLPRTLVAALQGTIQNTEQHTSRLLFKVAVEISLMAHVMAAAIDMSAADLDRLRGQCVQEVKKLNGYIALKTAAVGGQQEELWRG